MNRTKKAPQRAELNDRILMIRQALFSDNNRDFAQRIGELEQNLYNVCDRDANRNASLALVTKIVEGVPEVNARWLLTGRGDMLSPTSKGAGARSDMMKVIVSQQDTIRKLTDTIVGRRDAQ